MSWKGSQMWDQVIELAWVAAIIVAVLFATMAACVGPLDG